VPTFEVTLSLKLKGVEVRGFPINRRVEVGYFFETIDEAPAVSDTVTWNRGINFFGGTSNFLFVTASAPVSYRIGTAGPGSQDASWPVIPMQAGGILLFIDSTIPSGGSGGSIVMNNHSGETAVFELIAGGD
jgi:hypothetical protein